MIDVRRMKKFWIIAFALLLCGTPVIADGQSDEPQIEAEAVSMSMQGNRIHITNAEGMTLEIYNLTGLRVAMIKVDSNDRQIALTLTRGCYILKVGKLVRKITVK